MKSLTLGRIQGIEVKVHPTFGLVLPWIFFQWGRGAEGRLASILFGLLLVGLVFACVLLHELGHSLMAIHYQIRVIDITLLPFGAAARLEQVPARPASEVMIAIAGPAMNVAVAVALIPPLALLGVARGLGSPADYLGQVLHPSLAGLLVYLFVANVMIVLFNLLPAFPLDGGRVVRAGLSRLVGRERGTRVAVHLGQAVSLVMAVAGIWTGDYPLVAIAVFVVVVGYAEGRSVRVEGAMKRLRVGQFALWDMGGVAPHHPLTYALRGGPRDLAVTEDNRVVGMLWRNQLLHALNGGIAGRTVADVMDDQVVTADVDESVFEVQQRMNALNRWAMPIVEDGQYRGIFTADRFVHVYRQVAPLPRRIRPAGAFAAASATLGNLLRAWVR